MPGAINLPIGELEQMLGQLPTNRMIVAYCRGSYCVLSREAVHILHSHGYHVGRDEEGYPEWKAGGLPTN